MSIQGVMRQGRRAVALGTALLVAGLLGAPAALAADTTAPAAPTNLHLFPDDLSTDGHVELDWSASSSSDVEAYQIYRWHGTGTPATSEHTYLGQTTHTVYNDTLAREGQYRYAVLAVDEAGNKSRPTAWRSITVNKPANGQTVSPDTTAPGKATELAAAETQVDDYLVDLSWTEPGDNDLWRYLVYRSKGNAAASFLDYVEGDISFYTDQVSVDGDYSYHVVAQDLSGNLGPASASVKVTVDTQAPMVEITSPREGMAYPSSGMLAVTARVTENGSGYEPSGVKVYLDGALQTSSVLNLDNLAEGEYLVEVEVTDRAGNFDSDAAMLTITDDIDFDAPAMLTESGFSSTRSLKIEWAAPDRSGVTGYTVHRIAPDGTARSANLSSSARSHSITVDSDGAWSFYVEARYGTAKGDPSAVASILVDRTAPRVTISSPEHGKSYEAAGRLPVTYAVDDDLSGVAASSLKLFLDGRAFSASSISLSSLAAGDHTLKVVAADLAGNETTATARFTVVATDDDDDDEDDEDDDDDDDDRDDDDRRGRDLPNLKFNISAAKKAAIIKTLEEHRSEIHHGHYKALMAKAQADAWPSFVLHIIKHQGKFISRQAAEELLEEFGLEDVEIDPRRIPDSLIEGWSNRGPGTLPGLRGRGHK